MLIGRDGMICRDTYTRAVVEGRFTVYWEGFVYGYNQLAGDASVRAFIQAAGNCGISEARRGLRGSYAIAINDCLTGEWVAFSDPSRSIPWYYGGQAFSTSFLALAKHLCLDVDSLNPQAVVEFLLTGFQFGQEVFFHGIRVALADEIVHFRNGELWIETDRNILDPFRMPPPSDLPGAFLDAFRVLVAATHKENVSVDLTGGTDTRLIVAVLDRLGARFETAVSGTGSHPDVLISEKVAAALGGSHPHYPCIHSVNPEQLWQELYEVVQAVDGVSDGVIAHRLYQLYKSRASRGITVVIGGSGGELHKDGGWWRTAVLLGPGRGHGRRLIRSLVQSGLIGWGLAAELPDGIFSPPLQQIAATYKDRLFHNLEKRYVDNPSSGVFRLADRLFFEYSVRAPRGFGARLVPTYHPLLDVNFVAVGINLPKPQRFLHRFYRGVVGGVNPTLAELPTTRGNMTFLATRKGTDGTLRRPAGAVACKNRTRGS